MTDTTDPLAEARAFLAEPVLGRSMARTTDRALLHLRRLCDEVERLRTERERVVRLAEGYVSDGHVYPGAEEPLCDLPCAACAGLGLLDYLGEGSES